MLDMVQRDFVPVEGRIMGVTMRNLRLVHGLLFIMFFEISSGPGLMLRSLVMMIRRSGVMSGRIERFFVGASVFEQCQRRTRHGVLRTG